MTNEVTVWAYDFDNTMAWTSSVPIVKEGEPPWMSVETAYQYVFQKMYGLEVGRKLGAIGNRSPIELGELLEKHIPDFGIKGRSYYDAHRSELDSIMPMGVGAAIAWNDADAVRQSIVETFVRAKLVLLLPQFGKSHPNGGYWPRLVDGFAEHWRTICANPAVCRVIVSSGHDAAIKRTFEVYGLEQPQIIVSDDLLRRRRLKLSKPQPALWDVVLKEVRMLGLAPKRIVYCGDDPDKDGSFARLAGHAFHLITGIDSPCHGMDGTYSDWRDVPLPKAT